MDPDEALKNLKNIVKDYSDDISKFNEADTRAKIIDFILRDCLDWQEKYISRENPTYSGYIDYELKISHSTRLVIEAKRAGDYFLIPRAQNKRAYKLNGVLSTSDSLMKAIQQVREYCTDIGCKYAAVFNGSQIVIFPAFLIGKPWKEGYAIVFHSLKDIEDNFNFFFDILAFENVAGGSLLRHLDKKKRDYSYKKITSEIYNPDESGARNELYTYLQPLCDFVFSDLLDEKRTEVLKRCYVYDKSTKPLTTEIESYFQDKLPNFIQKYRISEILEKEAKAGSFEKDFAQRTFKQSDGALTVLLGGIGSGKSTFLHRFFKIILGDRENLLWFYIDFKNAPINENEIERYVFQKINDDWRSKYYPLLRETLDKVGFGTSDIDPKEFFTKLFALLQRLKFSITIIIDNVDQHNLSYQEKIFIFSSHLTDVLKTLTIVVLREETFVISTKIGVFNAYYVHKFHISSPNFLSMLLKRIEFTLNMLSDDLIYKKYFSHQMPQKARAAVLLYFKIIKQSLCDTNEQRRKIVNFIDNISLGNMREVLRMFTNYLQSGNTNIKEIFSTVEANGSYQLAYHQFIKAIMLGEHRFYSQDHSPIMNIFDFDPALSDSYSNNLRVLHYLQANANKISDIGRGYVAIDDILSSAEDASIRKNVVEDCLLRLAKFKLVEFDTQSMSDLKAASYAKITAAGRYYLEHLIYTFVYLDLVYQDTYICDQSLFKELRRTVNLRDVRDRLKRTNAFLEYLNFFEEQEYKYYPEYDTEEFTNVRFFSEAKRRFQLEAAEISAKLDKKQHD
jgi:hypothetical protein